MPLYGDGQGEEDGEGEEDVGGEVEERVEHQVPLRLGGKEWEIIIHIMCHT